MIKTLKLLMSDQNGATAIEYALVASLISIAATAAIKQIGTSTTNSFNNVSNNLAR